jgi:hypothetical protein
LSIHKGSLSQALASRYFFVLLVKVAKKSLTRRGKHPNLSSVCADRNFLFVVFNNTREIYLTV